MLLLSDILCNVVYNGLVYYVMGGKEQPKSNIHGSEAASEK